MKQVRFFGIIVLSLLLSYGVVHAGGAGGFGAYPGGTTATPGTYGTSGTSGTYGGGYGGIPPTYSRYSSGQERRPAGPDDSQGVRGPACAGFLDKTVSLRREFELKRFDYWELKRDPKAKPEDLAKGQEAVQDLFRKIQQENRDGCRWQD